MGDGDRATAHMDVFTVLTFVPHSGTGSSVGKVCLNGLSAGLSSAGFAMSPYGSRIKAEALELRLHWEGSRSSEQLFFSHFSLLSFIKIR